MQLVTQKVNAMMKVKKTFFDKNIDEEVEATPKTTDDADIVQAIKNCKLHITTRPTKLSNKL